MRSIPTAALLIGIGVGAAQAGGTVTVSFTEPEKFADAGNSRFEIPDTTKALAIHLQQLGQRHLPDGQTLSIEVLDIDLAGAMQPSRRTTRDIRVVKGQADWPRISLRYTLNAPGQAARSAEESISDLGYTSHITMYTRSDPLHYEKHMLSEWFKARFAPPQ